MLPALVKVMPMVIRYATSLYTREFPNLLFTMDECTSKVIMSARGAQQDSNLSYLYYSAGFLKILREFRTDSPILTTRTLGFIGDITVILPPESTRDTTTIAKVTSWLRECLFFSEGIQLICSKSQALLAGDIAQKYISETQHKEMAATQLNAVWSGMQIVDRLLSSSV